MPLRLRIAIVAFVLMCATFANNALSPLYVIYEARFHLTSLSVTAVFATYAAGVLVGLLCVGRLSDDVGRKPLLFAGTILLMASSVLFLFAKGFDSLIVARAVLGLATGALSSATTAALVDLQPDHNRQRAALLTTLAFVAGMACGPLIFGLVAQYLPNPRVTPFLIELGIQITGFIGVCLLSEPATHELVPLRWQIQRPGVPKEIRGSFALAGAVVMTGWMVGGIYAALSGSMDRQLLHVTNHAVAGLILFVFACSAGASQFLSRTRPSRRTMALGVIATAFGATFVVLALVTVSAPLFILATVVVGIGNGLCFIGSLALINEIAPRLQRAEIVAAYNLVAYFSLSLPVVGVGVLADLYGLRTATYTFASLLVVLAMVTLVALRHRGTTPAETAAPVAVGP